MTLSNKRVTFNLGCVLLMAAIYSTSAYSQVFSFFNGLGVDWLIRAPVKLPQLDSFRMAADRLFGAGDVPRFPVQPDSDVIYESDNVQVVLPSNGRRSPGSFTPQYDENSCEYGVEGDTEGAEETAPEDITDGRKRRSSVLPFFSGTGATPRRVSIHFVPRWNDSTRDSRGYVIEPQGDKDIDIVAETGLEAYAREQKRIAMMMQPDSTAGSLEWLSEGDWYQDIILAVPKVSQLIFTFVFTPFLSILAGLDMLNVDVYTYENKTATGDLLEPELLPPEIDKQALLEFYLAMIQSLIDELEGDYVLVVSPEEYRNKRYLLGERGTGLTSAICSFDHQPCNPFQPSQLSLSHYRSYLLIVGGGGGGKAGHQPGRHQNKKKQKPLQRPGTPTGEQKNDVSHDTGNPSSSVLVITGSPTGDNIEQPATPVQLVNHGTDAPQPQQNAAPPVNGEKLLNRLPDSKGIDPLIVELVNRSLDKIDENGGELDEADEADTFLYLVTIVAINEYMQGNGDDEDIGELGELSPEREELQKFLTRSGFEGYFRNTERLKFEYDNFLNRQKTRNFMLTRRATTGESEVSASLTTTIPFLIKSMMANWPLAEAMERWRTVLYSYILRRLFCFSRSRKYLEFFDMDEKALVMRMIDNATKEEGAKNWRDALIYDYPDDSYYEYDVLVDDDGSGSDGDGNSVLQPSETNTPDLALGIHPSGLSDFTNFFSLAAGGSYMPSVSANQDVSERDARRQYVEQSPGSSANGGVQPINFPHPFDTPVFDFQRSAVSPEPRRHSQPQPATQTGLVGYSYGQSPREMYRRSPYSVPSSPLRSRRHSLSQRYPGSEAWQRSPFSVNPNPHGAQPGTPVQEHLSSSAGSSGLLKELSDSSMPLSEAMHWAPPLGVQSESVDPHSSVAMINPPAGWTPFPEASSTWYVGANYSPRNSLSDSSDGYMSPVPPLSYTPAGTQRRRNERKPPPYPGLTGRSAVAQAYANQFVHQVSFSTQRMFDEALVRAEFVAGNPTAFYETARHYFMTAYPQETGVNDLHEIGRVFDHFYRAYLARKQQNDWPTPPY